MLYSDLTVLDTPVKLSPETHTVQDKTPNNEDKLVNHFDDPNHKIILLACRYHYTVMSLLTPIDF